MVNTKKVHSETTDNNMSGKKSYVFIHLLQTFFYFLK